MNRPLIILPTAMLLGLALSTVVKAQIKPDLVVTDLRVEPDQNNSSVRKVSVTVANVCRASGSAQSFVIVTFKESERPGAKALYFVGSKIRALKGGESQTVQFDAGASGKEVGIGSHIIAEVDPYKKISEVSEENNWRTVNPSAAGAPVNQSQCR